MNEPFVQSSAGTLIVTFVDPFGPRVPFGGLNVTPGRLLDGDADQMRLPWELADSYTVSVQV